MVAVMLGNDPQSYREAFAYALHISCPDASVRVVEPDDLDDEFLRYLPDIVICSRLTRAVEEQARAWLLLYPDGKNRVDVSVEGRRSSGVDINFDEVVALVRRMESAPGTEAPNGVLHLMY